MEIIPNEQPYCYLHFTANSLSGKIMVPKLWAKMLSAKEIAGFFKKYHFQKEMWDKVDILCANKHQVFLQVDTIVFYCF